MARAHFSIFGDNGRYSEGGNGVGYNREEIGGSEGFQDSGVLSPPSPCHPSARRRGEEGGRSCAPLARSGKQPVKRSSASFACVYHARRCSPAWSTLRT